MLDFYSATEDTESTVYMAKGAVEELAVQRIISCNKAVGGCNNGSFDYMNNAGGIVSDPGYPEVNNAQGRIHK